MKVQTHVLFLRESDTKIFLIGTCKNEAHIYLADAINYLEELKKVMIEYDVNKFEDLEFASVNGNIGEAPGRAQWHGPGDENITGSTDG